MAQSPTTGTPLNEGLLEQILVRAKSDTVFRDALLNSPAETLKKLGIRVDPKWIVFFSRLKASNFESAIQHRIESDPTGEGESEGSGEGYTDG